MAGLLSGLASLGLGNLEDMKVFEEPKKEDQQGEKEPEVPQIQEQDLVYEKSYECPVCSSKITSKVMKSGKARLIGADTDMRPKYEGIDPLKYDVVLCPKCGYAALTRYFKPLSPTQVKMVVENISQKVKLQPYDGDFYTYEEAEERYKLALACAVVKQAKPSEKAYVCLKTAWMLRGWAESLDEKAVDYQARKAMLEKEENDFLKTALDGFMGAMSTEGFPMCGMDETTMDYLIAVLAARFEQYDIASKMVASILTSPSANARMKDKTRDLKDSIMQALKKGKN